MEKLTKAQVSALAHISRTPVTGPSVGWNADCEMFTPEGTVDCAEIKPLFEMGFLETRPAPLPHREEFNEESGSITLDCEWIITPAGRAALEASNE